MLIGEGRWAGGLVSRVASGVFVFALGSGWILFFVFALRRRRKKTSTATPAPITRMLVVTAPAIAGTDSVSDRFDLSCPK